MLQPKSPVHTNAAQKWLRIAIVGIGSITFLCFLALSPVLRSLTKQDRMDSHPVEGVGAIEQIVPPHLEDNAKPIPAQVWVRVNGALAAAETVVGSAQLRVGGQARVIYRVGKSGRVYVDSVAPLDVPAHKSPAK